MFFLNNLVWVIKQFLTKMGEIAYLMPTEYQIFLGKGVLPSYNPRQQRRQISPIQFGNTDLRDRYMYRACTAYVLRYIL